VKRRAGETPAIPGWTAEIVRIAGVSPARVKRIAGETPAIPGWSQEPEHRSGQLSRAA